MNKQILNKLSLIIFIAASLFFIRSIKNNYRTASSPPDFYEDEKKMDKSLCRYFGEINSKEVCWQAFFDTYQAIPIIEYYYISGKLVASPRNNLFEKDLGFWKQNFPGMNKTQLIDMIKIKVEKEVDVLVVFKDTASNAALDWLIHDDYTKTITNEMTLYAQKSKFWKNVGEIPTIKYDTLLVYYKTK